MKHRPEIRICILQHSEGSPPGTLTDWLDDRGLEARICRLHKGEALPKLDDVDWLIILGGPMNVDDVHEFTWLRTEKAFLRDAIAAQKTLLGICLGGQLLSQALGGTVKKHSHWECGWHSVEIDGLASLSGPLEVFQYHQDTFSIPPGADSIATNAITPTQGFRFGDRVIGLQFHPETTLAWIESFADEDPWPTGPYVQDLETMLAKRGNLKPMREWFFSLLDEMKKAAE